MPLSLRNSLVFEFTLFLPTIRFNVIGFEPSKNLSLELSRLTNQLSDASQSLYDCGTVHIKAAQADLPSNTHGSVMHDRL